MNATEFNERLKQMTPGSAIRAFCVACCGGVFTEVKCCNGDGTDPAYYDCPFHSYRMGRGRPSVKTIRKHCLQCMGDSPSYVRECNTMDCVCHSYRMGKNPTRLGKGYFADRVRARKAEITPVNGRFSLQNQRSAIS